MDKQILEPLIESIAKSCNVDPDLALAISYVETGVNESLVRFEPVWNYLVSPEKYARMNGISVDTEITLQRISWGVMQLMGSNFRSLGFTGMLTLACQPSVGAMYACKYVQALQKKYTNELDIISSYNQGAPVKLNGEYRNNLYVTKVVDQLNYLRRK